MGAPRTTPKVLEALDRHRGLDVSLAMLVRETRLTGHQVQSAVHRLITRNRLPITVVVRGQIWRYEAANASASAAPGKSDPQDALFELVGTTKSGVQIVRGDQTNVLYTLEPLDFE